MLQAKDGLFVDTFFLPELKEKAKGSFNGDQSRYSIDKLEKKILNQTIDDAIRDLSPVKDHSVVNKRKTKLASILNKKEGEIIEICSVNNWYNSETPSICKVMVAFIPAS